MQPTSPSRQLNRRGGSRRKPCSTVCVECRKGALGLGPNLTRSVLDVSQTGVRLVLKTVLKKGEEAEVLISGYGARPIKCIAQVAWVQPLDDDDCLVGLSFRRPMPFVELQRIAKP